MYAPWLLPAHGASAWGAQEPGWEGDSPTLMELPWGGHSEVGEGRESGAGGEWKADSSGPQGGTHPSTGLLLKEMV